MHKYLLSLALAALVPQYVAAELFISRVEGCSKADIEENAEDEGANFCAPPDEVSHVKCGTAYTTSNKDCDSGNGYYAACTVYCVSDGVTPPADNTEAELYDALAEVLQ